MLLWENPNPTVNFAGQTVALSDDFANYDLIGITLRNTTTNADEVTTYYRVEEFALFNPPRKEAMYGGILATWGATSAYYVRSFYPATGGIWFGTCRSDGSNYTVRNNFMIPTKITGYKI